VACLPSIPLQNPLSARWTSCRRRRGQPDHVEFSRSEQSPLHFFVGLYWPWSQGPHVCFRGYRNLDIADCRRARIEPERVAQCPSQFRAMSIGVGSTRSQDILRANEPYLRLCHANLTTSPSIFLIFPPRPAAILMSCAVFLDS
jgi:hypothetical protein